MLTYSTVYIIISTSQQDTQGMSPNRPTEDAAFSTFMLLIVLNFYQSSVKYTLRNTENYCLQWLSGRLGTGIPPPHTPTTKATRSLRLRRYFSSNRPLPTQTPQLTHST